MQFLSATTISSVALVSAPRITPSWNQAKRSSFHQANIILFIFIFLLKTRTVVSLESRIPNQEVIKLFVNLCKLLYTVSVLNWLNLHYTFPEILECLFFLSENDLCSCVSPWKLSQQWWFLSFWHWELYILLLTNWTPKLHFWKQLTRKEKKHTGIMTLVLIHCSAISFRDLLLLSNAEQLFFFFFTCGCFQRRNLQPAADGDSKCATC